jgi:hypothetical protein
MCQLHNIYISIYFPQWKEFDKNWFICAGKYYFRPVSTHQACRYLFASQLAAGGQISHGADLQQRQVEIIKTSKMPPFSPLG